GRGRSGGGVASSLRMGMHSGVCGLPILGGVLIPHRWAWAWAWVWVCLVENQWKWQRGWARRLGLGTREGIDQVSVGSRLRGSSSGGRGPRWPSPSSALTWSWGAKHQHLLPGVQQLQPSRTDAPLPPSATRCLCTNAPSSTLASMLGPGPGPVPGGLTTTAEAEGAAGWGWGKHVVVSPQLVVSPAADRASHPGLMVLGGSFWAGGRAMARGDRLLVSGTFPGASYAARVGMVALGVSAMGITSGGMLVLLVERVTVGF
ncbi:unnamed protein product, partial [Discosporangium mesarthrocarpum]